MAEVVQTGEFEAWLKNLKDVRGRARILRRLDRLAQGTRVMCGRSAGLSELRLDVGPGYRIYYLQDGDKLILLLCGGDKSTQQKDINLAHELADQWRSDKKKEGRP